jgi:5-methylcytosine-specific restriction protein A
MTWIKRHGFPGDWPKRRRSVMARGSGQCETVTNGVRCPAVASQVDHVVPVAEGGSHDLTNLRAICIPHHATKTKGEAARGVARKPRERREPERHPGLM